MADGWGWLRSAVTGVDAAPDSVRAQVVAGVAVAVARRMGIALPDLRLLSAWGPPAPIDLPVDVVADPWVVGEALEVVLTASERRWRGSHFTPRAVARAVVGLVLGESGSPPLTTVCDPAVGGGGFLLAAAEALHTGTSDRTAVVRALSGVDLDPVAVAVAEVALCLWSGGAAVPDLVVADALTRSPAAWGGPTVVVGNPPFLGQLRTATARSPDRSGLRPDLATLAGPYTDTSALFAPLSTDLVAPGGRVALVLPRSFLVARDAGAARAATLRSAILERVWLPRQQLFGAHVEVCVPVWRRTASTTRSCLASTHGTQIAHAPTASVLPVPALGERLIRPPGGAGVVVRRSTGLPLVAARSTAAPAAGGTSWAHLLAGLDGGAQPPSLDRLRSAGVLGDMCTATAGFRDQYYGLIPFIVDDPERSLDDASFAPLITSGLIDPARSAWGERPTRYARRQWQAPRVDVAAVAAAGGALARWTDGKRVSKLLVAAQTRTIEAVADVDGSWLPSTPVATVLPEPGLRWHVLAVLLSPVATAWALLHSRGSGLNPNTIRLPPAALRTIPTPADERCWDVGAVAARAASLAVHPVERRTQLVAAAASMCDAYRIDAGPAVAWWSGRLPPG